MWPTRVLTLMVLGATAACAAACSSTEGSTTPSSAGSGGGRSTAAGTSTAGTAGASTSGASGTGGNAGSGGAPTGSGGSDNRRVVTSWPGLCTPDCLPEQFCALLDVGCSGNGPCLLEAACRPYPACSSTQACSYNPPDIFCADNTSDACDVGDCPGHCFCHQGRGCPDGSEFDLSPLICKCVQTPPNQPTCSDIDCPSGFRCFTVMNAGVCVKQADG